MVYLQRSLNKKFLRPRLQFHFLHFRCFRCRPLRRQKLALQEFVTVSMWINQSRFVEGSCISSIPCPLTVFLPNPRVPSADRQARLAF